MPNAVKEGSRLLSRIPHDAIVATGPPFSSFLVGAKLAQKHRIPLVLDYRDEWEISNSYWENKSLDPFSRRIQSGMQARVVRAAQALVASTKSSAVALERICRDAHSGAHISWIYNGFDPEDFSLPTFPACENNSPVCSERHQQIDSLRQSCYRIVYVGMLWNLTSVAPFVAAVQDLCRRHPQLAERLELCFIGRRTGPQDALLQNLRHLPVRLVVHPYLEHKEAVGWLRSADALLLLLSDLPNLERVVPAKIFEYMAANRPILAVAPRGEAWDLLGDYPKSHLFVPNEINGISRFLEQKIKQLDHIEQPPTPWDSSRYHRKYQAKQLSDILDSLT
jgi:glycosyltransferase involved in cell wall biosynthesis